MKHPDPRIEKIIDKIQRSGWELSDSDFQLEWWADTILKLKSVWSPTEVYAYLIILVDPQYPELNSRKSGQGVWGISINSHIPEHKNDYHDCWTLNEVVGEIDEFIELLDTIRKMKTQQNL